MSDAEVIEVLQEQIDKYGQEYDDKGIEALKIAIKLLEQTRWIPCSERPPKYNEDVFVQINNGGDRFIDIAHIVKMKHPAFDKDFYWEARHPWDDSSIEAWMPLPELYKPEMEVQE